VAYAQVLQHMGRPFRCAGRGAETAAQFRAKTGVPAGTGPLTDQLAGQDLADTLAIVAVDVLQLASVCEVLLDLGCARILVEKPGALDLAGMRALAAQDPEHRIRIAYNRRFLKSAQRAAEIIAQDGGVQTLHFEFTELPDRVESLGVHPPEVLANFGFANASHVFDLAFHLARAEADLSGVTLSAALQRGSLSWHDEGSRMVGCGAIGSEALFTCSADWRSGGGWAVELTTAHRRLRLRPLEQLTEQLRETFTVAPVALEVDPEGLKPGLYDMMQDMLERDGSSLPNMAQQVVRMECFARILGKPV
jgi:predicted dehydrogenase